MRCTILAIVTASMLFVGMGFLDPASASAGPYFGLSIGTYPYGYAGYGPCAAAYAPYAYPYAPVPSVSLYGGVAPWGGFGYGGPGCGYGYHRGFYGGPAFGHYGHGYGYGHHGRW